MFLSGISRFSNRVYSSREMLMVELSFAAFTAAEIGIIGTFSPNLVFANTFCKFVILFLIISSLFSSGIMSVLFNITIIFDISNSPITRHSAVYVYIPLLISMTRNIMSIILAPPIIVLISEACPGQSTSVNWKY